MVEHIKFGFFVFFVVFMMFTIIISATYFIRYFNIEEDFEGFYLHKIRKINEKIDKLENRIETIENYILIEKEIISQNLQLMADHD